MNAPPRALNYGLSRHARYFIRGFSLVEVVIALGIVCVAFIPLMGLLATGLNVFQGSMDQTVASQIVQRLGNEAQGSDFDAVSTPSGFRYFNAESGELSVTKQSDAIYVSRMAVLEEAASPYMKRLVIQVARNPGGSVVLQETSLANGSVLWSDANFLPVVTRSLLLARNSSVP